MCVCASAVCVEKPQHTQWATGKREWWWGGGGLLQKATKTNHKSQNQTQMLHKEKVDFVVVVEEGAQICK